MEIKVSYVFVNVMACHVGVPIVERTHCQVRPGKICGAASLRGIVLYYFFMLFFLTEGNVALGFIGFVQWQCLYMGLFHQCKNNISMIPILDNNINV